MSIINKFFTGPATGAADEENQEVAMDPEEEQLEESGEDGQLALDVYQDKDNIIIKSTIAGVKPEDLDITIGSDQVSIRGERRAETEVKKDDYFFQECYWGGFSRILPLPVEVDVDKASADLKDGILTLVLPKAGRAKTKKVKIKQEE